MEVKDHHLFKTLALVNHIDADLYSLSVSDFLNLVGHLKVLVEMFKQGTCASYFLGARAH